MYITNGTLLLINPLSGAPSPILTPYAARGITQTFTLIPEAAAQHWLRRDVNGGLDNLTDTRFRKYATTISCRDGETPCLDDAWIGIEVELFCAFELSFLTGGSPARPMVSGSSRTQAIPNSAESITYYRPILFCLIANIKNSFAEYPAQNEWQMDFLEK
jgi:hypothetical protein